jgi:hypothetical protein
MEVIPIIVDQIDRLLSTNCVEAKLNQLLKGIMGGETIKTKTNKEKTIALPVYATGLKKSKRQSRMKTIGKSRICCMYRKLKTKHHIFLCSPF